MFGRLAQNADHFLAVTTVELHHFVGVHATEHDLVNMQLQVVAFVERSAFVSRASRYEVVIALTTRAVARLAVTTAVLGRVAFAEVTRQKLLLGVLICFEKTGDDLRVDQLLLRRRLVTNRTDVDVLGARLLQVVSVLRHHEAVEAGEVVAAKHARLLHRLVADWTSDVDGESSARLE